MTGLCMLSRADSSRTLMGVETWLSSLEKADKSIIETHFTASRNQQRSRRQQVWTKKYITSVALITVAILATGGLLWNSGRADLKPDFNATADASWYRGAEDAPITIDVYPDFECHICVEKELMVVQALVDYPGKIRMVYHHYADPGFSEKLAEALEAAGEQGKFWEMHDRLIRNVPSDIGQLQTVAEEIELDIGIFNEALERGQFTEKVRLAKQEATAAGVKYVSVFINGKEYQKNPGTLDDFYAAINDELERLDADVGD